MVPTAILEQRGVCTTSGTYAGYKYLVQWAGTTETSYEPFAAVCIWEVYSLYNLRFQGRVKSTLQSRIIQ